MTGEPGGAAAPPTTDREDVAPAPTPDPGLHHRALAARRRAELACRMADDAHFAAAIVRTRAAEVRTRSARARHEARRTLADLRAAAAGYRVACAAALRVAGRTVGRPAGLPDDPHADRRRTGPAAQAGR